MKSRERWDYYSIIYFEDIVEYALINEIDPVVAFDDFVLNYCSNTVKILAPEKEELMEEIDSVGEEDYDVEEDSDSLFSSYLSKEADEVDAGADMVSEADDYSDFYVKTVRHWEDKVVRAMSKIPVEKDYDCFVKTFGEFLSRMMNSINTLPFLGNVKKYIKQSMIAGLSDAEEDTGVDIGWDDKFDAKLKVLEQQQIDGYTINGKKWFGIKGATKELQHKILSSIQNDLGNNTPRKEMVENVRDIFQGSTVSQAERITRTETTRFVNESKLLGYKESGIQGKKLLSVALDNRTSPICTRLFGRYGNKGVGLDDPFVDPETNKNYSTPPFHPNCRSVLVFRAD